MTGSNYGMVEWEYVRENEGTGHKMGSEFEMGKVKNEGAIKEERAYVG